MTEVSIESVASFIRDAYEMPDLDLSPDSDLVDLLERRDPEEFQWFLGGVSRRFGIHYPVVRNPWKYLSALWKWRGHANLAELSVFVSRTPYISMESLQLKELVEFAKCGAWPRSLVIPPGLDGTIVE